MGRAGRRDDGGRLPAHRRRRGRRGAGAGAAGRAAQRASSYVVAKASCREIVAAGTLARAVAINSAGRGCPYVHLGDTITYYLSRTCLPTRYAFPSHLSDQKEAGAIGVDQVTEIHRIFATHPGIVVTWEGMQPRNSADSVAAVEDELSRHYRKVLEVPVGRHTRQIYQRRPDDEAPQAGTGPR